MLLILDLKYEYSDIQLAFSSQNPVIIILSCFYKTIENLSDKSYLKIVFII